MKNQFLQLIRGENAWRGRSMWRRRYGLARAAAGGARQHIRHVQTMYESKIHGILPYFLLGIKID